MKDEAVMMWDTPLVRLSPIGFSFCLLLALWFGD